MPQMSPLMWTLLFIVFSTTLILVSKKIFFTSTCSVKSEGKKTELPSVPHKNWTW